MLIGGVGVFAVQLARIVGARVIGTGSPSSAGYLQSLGAEPVADGDGLLDRIHDLGAVLDIAHLIASGELHVPIAATVATSTAKSSSTLEALSIVFMR